MAQAVKTAPYLNSDGRFVEVSNRNANHVNHWLGESGDLTWVNGKKGEDQKPKFRVKTPKGVRIAVAGDLIVKFGRGKDATFIVDKAS